MTEKKLRKCISCGIKSPQDSMIRIMKEHAAQNVVINPNSKTFGRSAYLCYNLSCIEQAFKKNRLNKILKTTSEIEKADLIKLLKA